MNPEDVPTSLPDHPDEARLRKAEREMAGHLRRLSRKLYDTLDGTHPRRRVDAAVLLAQVAQTAAAGQQAMVAAINDQMAAGRDQGQ